MNELIRKLSEQARKYASDYVADCKHYGYYMEHNEYELRFEEKFTELIVQECCFVGEQYADGLFDSKHYAFVNKKIREHFGVEEK